MGISIEFNPREHLGKMQLIEKQLPWAAAQALNDVAKGFQADERQVISGGMTIRRPWVLQGVKIDRGDFATKQKVEARVRVDEQHDFLVKFEQGGARLPRTGRSLAVPVNVRRTKAQIIQKAQRPKSFNFQQGFSSTKSRWTIYKGDRRTFILQRPDGSGLILQRTGRARLGPTRHGDRNAAPRRGWGHDPYLVQLWALRPTTPVPRLLWFEQTARKSWLSRWPGSFEKWYLEALRTAK